MTESVNESIDAIDPELEEEMPSDPVAVGNLRVLLVEDSMPVRGRIRSMIEESGLVDVIAAGNSVVEALALFIEHQPEAVVLDLYLKDGNAFGVITEFKRARPACTVIVLTSFATPETREHCLQLGANYFFEKNREFERVPEVLGELQRAKARSLS